MKYSLSLLVFLIAQMSLSLYAADNASFIEPQLSLTEKGAYLELDGNLGFTFSRAALEALDNGLPLTISTEVRLVDPDKWFFGRTLWSSRYSHEIQYHALSHQYLVTDMQNISPTTALSRDTAMQTLGQVNKLNLTRTDILGDMKHYELEVISALDINTLPTPLRPLAYLSEEWRLHSKWKTLQTR